MRFGGLVLAGGAGTRFGGHKLVAELWGEPLVAHAVRAQQAVGELERVVVVTGPEPEEVGAAARAAGAEAVACPEWADGPTATLRAGIAALGDVDAAIVTLGDQPLVTPEAIARAVEVARRVPLAARATYAGRPGHPVVLRRALFGEVARLRGGRGARELLRAVGATPFEVGDVPRADDVDTPEDLARLTMEAAPA